MRTSSFVVLGLAVLGQWACSRESEKPPAPPRLFATETAEPTRGAPAPAAPVFTHLTVKARGATTELERTPEGWRITSPVEAKADPYAVDAMVQQLTTAKFKATVNAAPSDADLKKFGLTSPKFTVTARAYVPDASGGGADDPSRQRTVTLSGGEENPFDGSVYVRRDGDATVYAAEGAVRWSLDKGPFELRSKEFLGPLDAASLQSIEVTAKDHAYLLTREADGKTWRMVKPEPTRANASRVADLLTAFAGQQALSFPEDTPAARKALGLDAPLVDARFVPASGEPIRVRLSQVTRDGAPVVHALREQGARSTLAEVDARALTTLDVGVPELKDRRVLAFAREAVRQLEFHPGGKAAPVVVARGSSLDGGSDAWRIEGPDGGLARHFRVVKLLGTLESLRAAAFGEANVKRWERYGISEASRSVVLRDADGRELARLWLGHAVPEQDERLYARGSGPDLVEVSASAVAALPTSAADLKDAPPGGPDGGAPSP
ncbi:DUF4340 domain-containing protein [Corallococcus sp. CA047B]|uniref:DUF4340 domain-containing protein n=1 Tax=Corallococcus sp. CA047B TaxID=2316729 RepID=UPI000EA205BE|nr:DUF4340 domain-containing protein [Corallococcus sp. CA047B]RKH20944.1 DUF4340 domain-containing protein [Corallococcus sp. CA047B]